MMNCFVIGDEACQKEMIFIFGLIQIDFEDRTVSTSYVFQFSKVQRVHKFCKPAILGNSIFLLNYAFELPTLVKKYVHKQATFDLIKGTKCWIVFTLIIKHARKKCYLFSDRLKKTIHCTL